MSQNNDNKKTSTQASTNTHAQEALLVAKKANKLARKRNRIAKQQYHQSVLNYEQSERHYLIEKSKMQPTFRLVVTEFLMCKPDFMNDPEQASEAKFLADLGVTIDERVLRIKLNVKGDAEYMRPSIVVKKNRGHEVDECAYAMTELIYFVQVDSLKLSTNDTATIYLVYQDKTTLPVIHKYCITQQLDSALRRWDAVHLDTVYVPSRNMLSKIKSSAGCAEFFIEREE